MDATEAHIVSQPNRPVRELVRCSRRLVGLDLGKKFLPLHFICGIIVVRDEDSIQREKVVAEGALGELPQ